MGDQIRGSMPASVLQHVQADGPGGWAIVARYEREPGNPCIGIAIGCVLSLPIWVGVLVLCRAWG